jgi:hypothetical protein
MLGRKSFVRKPRKLAFETLESRDVPAPLAWSAGASLPVAEGGISAQVESAGVLALGGPSTTSYNVTTTNPSWQATVAPTLDPLDFARSSPGVAPLPSGYVLVFGGTQSGFATSSVSQYDPYGTTTTNNDTGTTTSNDTRSLRSMNSPRALFGWATDPASSTVYAIGGQDNNGTPLASVEAYNPTTNTWSYVTSLPQTLFSESAVSDGNGHIYTFGGVGANGAITNNVYRYSIATNTWDQVASLQVGVSNSAAVLVPKLLKTDRLGLTSPRYLFVCTRRLSINF